MRDCIDCTAYNGSSGSIDETCRRIGLRQRRRIPAAPAPRASSRGWRPARRGSSTRQRRFCSVSAAHAARCQRRPRSGRSATSARGPSRVLRASPDCQRRRPIGSVVPKNFAREPVVDDRRRAGDGAVSESVNSRPLFERDVHRLEVAGRHLRAGTARSATRRASSRSLRRGSRCRCGCRRAGWSLVTPAAWTPGSARTRFEQPIRERHERGIVRVRASPAASTACRQHVRRHRTRASRPAPARKLASSRPAPMSSMNANATCADTSARRAKRAPRPAVPLRPSSRNAWLRFMCRSTR